MTSRTMCRHAPKFDVQLPARVLLPVVLQCGVSAFPQPAASLQPTIPSSSLSSQRFAASEIVPGLFLGDYDDAHCAHDLLQRNIRFVLNVAEECQDDDVDLQRHQCGIQVRHLLLRDHSDEDIAQHFDEAIQFIESAANAQASVLVHCRMGVSRSATIVIAYLMASRHMHYPDAFDWVKRKRPQVSPNFGFSLALRKFEEQLRCANLREYSARPNEFSPLFVVTPGGMCTPWCATEFDSESLLPMASAREGIPRPVASQQVAAAAATYIYIKVYPPHACTLRNHLRGNGREERPSSDS